jgi:aspartyl/glutamyl-tRNA(Asn/Gln) amidotransferase C subunit
VSPIDHDDIERLAELAGLEVSPSELSSVARDIASILSYVSQISDAVDFHPEPENVSIETGKAVRLRPDVIDSSAKVRNLGAMAPDSESGFVLVPRLESVGDD